MKKVLTILVLFCLAKVGFSQVVISGIMANPLGTDAPYEYVQLVATQNINFATTPHTVVFCNNGSASTKGWVGGGNLTYSFIVNSGSVSKGDVFYVGGSGKLICGSGSTDISGLNWIKTINTGTTAGDVFGNANSSGSLGNAGTADGVAVFNSALTVTDSLQKPIDCIFFGSSVGAAKPSSGGYTVADNDHYSSSQGVFGAGTNTYMVPEVVTGFNGYFIKLNGQYNSSSNTWTTARQWDTVRLTSGSAATDIASGISVITNGPTITLDQSGFTNDFGLTYPNVPSSGSNFLVSGSNLTDSITITAAAPFEIRIGVNPYASGSIKLAPSGGTVNTTVLDVRFNPSATGTYTDTIYFTSSGATTQKVWVKGNSSNAPEVSFSNAAITVSEGVGTVKVQVNIANASSLSTSVDVALVSGTTATAGSDFTFTSPNTITFPSNSSDSIVLNIPISNDNIVEGNESFTLVLTNATNGASIGSNDSITITINDDDYRPVGIASIATANATGAYDSTGKRFEVTGVVYGINQRNVGAGLQFVLRDATGGINVFSGVNLYGYTVRQGDSVTVKGTLSPFNGLAEIVLNTANPGDTIIYHAAGRIIKTPKVISVLNESGESDLVQLNGVRVQFGGTWISGNNNIITAAGDTLAVRLVSNTNNLIGTNKPSGKFNIVGLGGQFDNSSPYNSGYQLFPRDSNDVIIPIDSLAHFVLISPSNGATVSIEGSTITSIDFAWDQALPASGVQTPTYQLYIDEDSGTFASPLLVYQSNLGGTGTQKSVYYDTLISILLSKGLSVGQTVNLKWNVKATTGAYSRWADSSYSLVLSRGVMNGIHKNSMQLMAMYPNPAGSTVTVSVPTAIVSARAYSLDGKLVKTFATGGNNSEVLDVSGLADGIYMLNVSTAEGSFTARLAIKN